MFKTDNDESIGGPVLIPNSHQLFIDLQFIIDEDRLWGGFVSMPSELIERSHPCLKPEI